MGMGVGVHICHGVHVMWRLEDNVKESVVQINLKLSGLAARTFTHLEIFPALHFKKLTCWFL